MHRFTCLWLLSLFTLGRTNPQTIEVKVRSKNVSPRDSQDPKYVVGLVKADVEIVERPSARSIVMTAPDGVKYKCQIPDPNANETLELKKPTIEAEAGEISEEAFTTKLSANIKRKLGSRCLTKVEGYWTYEVCPFRKVQQYHQEGVVKSLEFNLGTHDESLDGLNHHTELTQTFAEGSGGRQSLVRYVCNPNKKAGVKMLKKAAHVIKTVLEPQELMYHFEIHTTAACMSQRPTRGPKTPLELILPIQNQCTSHTQGWWTYTVCFLKSVTQMHEETIKKAGATAATRETTALMNLGTIEKHLDLEATVKVHRGASNQESYLSQYYDGGTLCDVGLKQARRTEVRYYCHPEENIFIISVTEVEACSYVIRIDTKLLCTHEAFEPPKQAVNEMVCQPMEPVDRQM